MISEMTHFEMNSHTVCDILKHKIVIVHFNDKVLLYKCVRRVLPHSQPFRVPLAEV